MTTVVTSPSIKHKLNGSHTASLPRGNRGHLSCIPPVIEFLVREMVSYLLLQFRKLQARSRSALSES